jgi:hypothetical protein
VIGFLGGIGFLFSYLGAAWTKDETGSSFFGSGIGPILLALAIIAVIGIFLFPRTVGMMFTPMFFATPVAFLVAIFRNGFGYAMFILGVGIAAWLVTFIVGTLRPDAT